MRIGCDLVEVTRFEKLLKNETFIHKIFHPVEISYCAAQAKPSHHYAARFAAKEAFTKALGTGFFNQGVTLDQVWVLRGEDGRPSLEVSAHLNQLLLDSGLMICDVTLSHHGTYAMAVALLGKIEGIKS